MSQCAQKQLLDSISPDGTEPSLISLPILVFTLIFVAITAAVKKSISFFMFLIKKKQKLLGQHFQPKKCIGSGYLPDLFIYFSYLPSISQPLASKSHLKHPNTSVRR